MIEEKHCIVIKAIKGEFTCLGSKEYVCKPRGLLKNNENYIKVGDFVDIDAENKIILKLYKRKNNLIRPVISNIDKAFVTTSVKKPELNLNLLDKMISILEYNDITPILIFSKIDLLDNDELMNFKTIKNYYKSIGYKVFLTKKDDLEDIKQNILDEIKDNVCVMMGQTGVGKSTFINNLNQMNLQTNEISEALGRGKHTTRHIELFLINNGYLADSPGFGNISLDNMDEAILAQTFKEFFENSKGCKYNGCKHINEPQCKIKELVTTNKIMKSRYDNYVSFYNELKKQKKY